MNKEIEADKFMGNISIFCHNHGYIFSQQRKNVFKFLFINNDFIEAEDLWLLLAEKKIKISLPSVYAALRWFLKYNFIERKRELSKKWTYKVISN